mgnify:CR=1 FL=1
MKTTLIEEVNNFKRLIGEATDTSSSGAYEQPLGWNQSKPTSPCSGGVSPLVGSEVGAQAPQVGVVDITSQINQQPTTQVSNQPSFDDMPFLSSHPSDWSFDGDEDEFLQNHGWERPSGPTTPDDEEAMSVAFDELGHDSADDELELDDDTNVFNTLQMFTETKNGLGWK